MIWQYIAGPLVVIAILLPLGVSRRRRQQEAGQPRTAPSRGAIILTLVLVVLLIAIYALPAIFPTAFGWLSPN